MTFLELAQQPFNKKFNYVLTDLPSLSRPLHQTSHSLSSCHSAVRTSVCTLGVTTGQSDMEDWPLGSVEIGGNSKFGNGYCFYIALGGEDQDVIFFPGLVSHLAGWNFI